ncbi:hypothetical protein FACS18947_4460 [Bacteroidia bacterium]|nr:hypothetical protein FACS18947_4460 [Bacteroidia bacterium]
MNYNFARAYIAKAARRRIVFICIIFVLSVLIAISLHVPNPSNLYFQDVSFATGGDLRSLYDAHTPYVKTEASFFLDTGYYWEKDNQITHKYYAIEAEDYFILCRVDDKFEGDELENYALSGKIMEPSSDEEELFDLCASDIAESWNISQGEARAMLCPLMIRNDYARVADQIIFAIAVIFGIFLLVRLVLALRDLVDYKKSSSYKKLAKAGVDPETVNNELSRDFEYGQFALKQKGVLIMRNWIVQTTWSGFTARRKNTLLWFYQTITRNRYNGIPVGKTYTVTLQFSDGGTVTLVAKKKTVNGILNTIAAAIPEALCGYSDELSRIFVNNRSEFLRMKEDLRNNNQNT